MDYDELKEAFMSVVEENDPLKACKQLQIKYWYSSFLQLFDCLRQREPTFFLDVLTDGDCWEESDTVHGTKLNRRIVAKKMLQLLSWKCTANPLDDFERYQLACWCCLEQDIAISFRYFTEQAEVMANDLHGLKNFVTSLSGDLEVRTDAMIEYWSHVMNGNIWKLKLEGKNLFVYGLDCVFNKMYFKHVEAVEFFWLKIKAVPENELSDQQKNEIFMNTVIRASASSCGSQPEIFEFCFSQLNPEKYPELLRRDFEANRYYASFIRLKNAFRFDMFQKLFDCLNPSEITEDQYHHWLRLLKIEKYPQYYEHACVQLFHYMWLKEGFDNHRSLVIREELTSSPFQGKLLIPLIKKNYMELVWAILDKANPEEFNAFKASDEMTEISLFLKQKDPDSFLKFINYY